ncbi:hypothetical protein ACTOB_005199 [Actinoplanes oblitus]|uniref:Glycerophosphoryl diester phosphodiesterase membrane domain-containing protein n=1 Tax=Actinoplanes oblitus TaxID=3040509 RepID=A0ABY8W7C3_9ACTN|nr:hypothetical protein [Actinoplanes oblitus]WIM93227.1 hypothetical protein ACTOB_005199 [Actinoplanes oblitus]
MRGEAAGPRRIPAILPLRATTVGESLDGAVALLRQRALPLLVAAAVLAAGEQWALTIVGSREHLPAIYNWTESGSGVWWPSIATSLALEAGIIALLGAFAGAAAGPALLGRAMSHRQVLRRSRPGRALVIAVLLTAVAWPAAYAGLIGFVLLYGLFGLATVILTMDRVGNPVMALIRSVRLSVRGMRVARIRILGFLVWLGIRFALGVGWMAVAGLILGFSRPSWLGWAVTFAWALANTVAYAALACLDAVLLIEARIRTEGLDIALNRSRSRGEDEAALLVVAR